MSKSCLAGVLPGGALDNVLLGSKVIRKQRCRIEGKVTQLGINSKFEAGEVWLCFPNSVQDSERERQKKIALGELFSHGISSQKQVVTRSLPRRIESGTEKKKGLWDLRQDVDDLRHPLPKLSSRKTPPSSHTALEVPASAGLQWGADADLSNPMSSYTVRANSGRGRGTNPWLQTVKPPRAQEIWTGRVLSTGICALNKATSPWAAPLLCQHKSHLPHRGFSHIL